MSQEKQRNREMEEFRNPHILTLDQALKLWKGGSTKSEAQRRSANRAVRALCNRVTCRFTGPSNFSRLTYGERMVWDLTYMQGEVLNGGFHQYLTNSTGETAEDIKVYLRDLGAVQTLGLFKHLSKLFPGSKVPRDQAKRCEIVEEWENPESGKDVFDELDRRFYRQTECLDALLMEYARMHRDQFIEPLDEVVLKFKRRDRITAYCCGSAVPEWMDQAEAALHLLEEFVKTRPPADWRNKPK